MPRRRHPNRHVFYREVVRPRYPFSTAVVWDVVRVVPRNRLIATLANTGLLSSDAIRRDVQTEQSTAGEFSVSVRNRRKEWCKRNANNRTGGKWEIAKSCSSVDTKQRFYVPRIRRRRYPTVYRRRDLERLSFRLLFWRPSRKYFNIFVFGVVQHSNKTFKKTVGRARRDRFSSLIRMGKNNNFSLF